MDAPKALVNVGALMTFNVAEAVPLGLACVEVAVLDTLFFAPSVVARTLTLTVQVTPAIIEPPLNVSDVLPAVGAKVPPQVFVTNGVAATSTPAGSESVKATADRACAGLGLASVKVKVETPVFVAIVVGLNALLKFGA